jgi:hypothetical protein
VWAGGCCDHGAEPSGPATDGSPPDTRVLNTERIAYVLLFATLKRELSKTLGSSGAEASGSVIRKMVAFDLPVGASCVSYLSRFDI